MITRKSALLTPFIAAAAIATAWIAPASALPLYHLTICGTASGCEVQNLGGLSPGVTDSLLTNDSFAQFYPWAPPGATFAVNIEGGIPDSFVYGTVQNPDLNLADGFFAHGGQILFNYDPEAVTFAGVNDSGVAIGKMLDEGIIQDAFDRFSLPEYDEASLALMQSLVPGSFLENSYLAAIDDEGRIFGDNAFIGKFQLTPVGLEPPVPVTDLPEPSSLVMLAGALGMLRWVRRRDRRHS